MNPFLPHEQDSVLSQQVILLEDILRQLFQDERQQYLSLLVRRIPCLQCLHEDSRASEHTACNMLLFQ